MAHAYKSANFVLFPTPVVPPLRATIRARDVKKIPCWTQEFLATVLLGQRYLAQRLLDQKFLGLILQ